MREIGLAFLFAFLSQGAENDFHWPKGEQAAVCLTYDDAMDCHLDSVAPDLNALNLKATFFLAATGLDTDRVDRWRALAQQGHELGNHTLHHACSKNNSWNKRPERWTENYSVRQMIEELEICNAFLYAIDGRKTRTLAFPCMECQAGGKSYLDTLRPLGLFVAARAGGPRQVADVKTVDYFQVPSWMVHKVPAEQMIDFVKEAGLKNAIAVFMFHGVSGEYINVTRAEHRKLLDFLAQNRKEYWTAPFITVMEHVKRERKRLGLDQ
jgi:peptidoglycan-N-acetylglucosamine deacetylase